jgi:REP element-mobilizing transposase RayT
VFQDDRDCELFLEKLGRAAEDHRVQVRAYCLMGNHFHLYVCTQEGNLSRFMHALLVSFSVSSNLRHHERGHLFQGRFKALVVEDDKYGSEVTRYIHLNPGRLKSYPDVPIAARQRAIREYRWSSYGAILGLRKCPGWLDRTAVLSDWGSMVAEQREQYASFVEQGLTADVADPFEVAAAQAVLGSDSFVDHVRRSLHDLAENVAVRQELGRNARVLSWVSAEDLISAVCEAWGVDRGYVLRRHSRGNEARQVLLYLLFLYARGRHTVAELGTLCGVSGEGIARAHQLLEIRLQGDRELRDRVERVKSMVGVALR